MACKEEPWQAALVDQRVFIETCLSFCDIENNLIAGRVLTTEQKDTIKAAKSCKKQQTERFLRFY